MRAWMVGIAVVVAIGMIWSVQLGPRGRLGNEVSRDIAACRVTRHLLMFLGMTGSALGN
jgi:hypothetical protein